MKMSDNPTKYEVLIEQYLRSILDISAQRMFGRRTRTLLPTTSYQLKPKVQEDVKEELFKQKSKQAKYYNQNTKELPPLQTGEVVRVAPKPGDRERKWFKARVEDQVDIRSYEVRTEDGRLYRRNRRHLRQSKEPFGQTSEPVQCDYRRKTTLAQLPPQLNQYDPSLLVNQSKTTLLVNLSKRNL